MTIKILKITWLKEIPYFFISQSNKQSNSLGKKLKKQ